VVAGQGLSIAEYQRLNWPSPLVRWERRETDSTKIGEQFCPRDLRSWSPSWRKHFHSFRPWRS